MENEESKRKCAIEKLDWCTHDEEVTESSMVGKNGRIDLKRKNKGVPIFSIDVQPTQNDGVERFATGTFSCSYLHLRFKHTRIQFNRWCGS